MARLQNSRIFFDCERRSIFERKGCSECKNGEGEWRETLHTRGSHLTKTSENAHFAVYLMAVSFI